MSNVTWCEWTKSEARQRAQNKAFAKISFIELENRTYKRDIKAGGDGRLSVDLLQRCLNSNEKELLTWKYIAKLIDEDE